MDVFEKAFMDIRKDHSLNKKKKALTETDYLLFAFMALLKSYMLRTNGKVSEPPTFITGV